MTRAVLDANVIVSALLVAAGPSARVLDSVRDGSVTWILSPAILAEVEKVLGLPRIRRKYAVNPANVQLLVSLLGDRVARILGTLEVAGESRDPKDDHVLACALEGQADFIVTGDEDLLSLKQYEDVKIVTPREFLEKLGLAGK